MAAAQFYKNKKQAINDPAHIVHHQSEESTCSGMRNPKSIYPNTGRNKTSFPGID